MLHEGKQLFQPAAWIKVFLCERASSTENIIRNCADKNININMYVKGLFRLIDILFSSCSEIRARFVLLGAFLRGSSWWFPIHVFLLFWATTTTNLRSAITWKEPTDDGQSHAKRTKEYRKQVAHTHNLKKKSNRSNRPLGWLPTEHSDGSTWFVAPI